MKNPWHEHQQFSMMLVDLFTLSSRYILELPPPPPVTVTTRIIRFLVGNPFKPSFNDCYWWLFVRFSAEADYTAPELEARQSAKP